MMHLGLLVNMSYVTSEFPKRWLYQGSFLHLNSSCVFSLFIRLKSYNSDASQFDSHTAHYQHHPRDTNTHNQTHVHGMTSVYKGDATVESGLDWFHSITSSGSPDDLTPTLTSTQENLNRKPNSIGAKTTTAVKQPTCQTEEDFQKNIGSTLTHEGTVTTASKEENKKTKKNEYIKEKSSICQEVHQPERQKDDQHSKSLGCVFQRVSKNLRDKRLGEQESNNLQCNKVEGRGHGDSVVFSDGRGKNVSHVLNATSDSHRSSIMSSGKNLPSNYLMHKNQSCGKRRRFEKEDKINHVFSLGKEKSAQGKSVGRIKKSNDSEKLCQQQRTRDNNSDMTIEDDFTGSPHLNASTQINDSTPSHPGHTKSTIPSSTLAKLSRFSFTGTTKPTTTALMQVEINPPTEVEKCLFKRKQGTESPTGTNCKAKQTETVNAAKRVMNDDLEYESTVNVKKRRSFKMGPPPSTVHDSKGPFSGLSLFHSIEFSNDVLDTDWDQEFSNRGKLWNHRPMPKWVGTIVIYSDLVTSLTINFILPVESFYRSII